MKDMATGPTVLTVLLNWRTAEMTLRAADAAERAMEGTRRTEIAPGCRKLPHCQK